MFKGWRAIPERLLLLWRTHVWLPAPSWRFSTMCNANFQGPSALFCLLGSGHTVMHRRTCRQNIHIITWLTYRSGTECPEIACSVGVQILPRLGVLNTSMFLSLAMTYAVKSRSFSVDFFLRNALRTSPSFHLQPADSKSLLRI